MILQHYLRYPDSIKIWCQVVVVHECVVPPGVPWYEVENGRAVVEDIGEVFGVIYAGVDWFVGLVLDGAATEAGFWAQTWQFMDIHHNLEEHLTWSIY